MIMVKSWMGHRSLNVIIQTEQMMKSAFKDVKHFSVRCQMMKSVFEDTKHFFCAI